MALGTISFGAFAAQTASLQAEVPKKLLCGIQTCQHVIGLEADTVALHGSIARRCRDIRRHADVVVPTMTAPTGEMAGMLKSFQSLTSLIIAMGASSEKVAAVVQKDAVAPLQHTLTNLVQRKERLLIEKRSARTRSRSPGTPEDEDRFNDDQSWHTDNRVDHARLQAADQEVAEAVRAKQQLVDRFGSRLKSTLLEAAEVKIQQAQIHRDKIRASMRVSTKNTREKATARAPASPPYEAAPGAFDVIDAWELERLNAVKSSFHVLAKSLYNFHRRMLELSIHFAQEVENFYPTVDHQMWLSQVLRAPVDLKVVETTLRGTSAENKICARADIVGLALLLPATTPGDAKESVFQGQDCEKAYQASVKELNQLRAAQEKSENQLQRVKQELLSKELELKAMKEKLGGNVHSWAQHSDLAPSPHELTDPQFDTDIGSGRPPKKKKKGWAALLHTVAPGTGKSKKETTSGDVTGTASASSVVTPTNDPDVEPGGYLGRQQYPNGDSSSRNHSTLDLHGPPPDDPGGTGPQMGSSLNSGGDTGRLPKERVVTDAQDVHNLQSPQNKPLSDTSIDYSYSRRDEAQSEEHRFQDLSPGSSEQPTPTSVDSIALRPHKVLDPEISSPAAAEAAALRAAEQIPRFLPDLLEHLNHPIERYSGAREAEYFLELQRRFEEFLLALRNFDLAPYTRSSDWSDPNYFRGPDSEEGFSYFPYKMPGGTPVDVSRSPSSVSLEWGAPQIDDKQWGLVAYETLLLVYLHLAQRAAEAEVHRLPSRDIHSISAEQYAAQVLGPSLNPNTVGADRGLPGAQGRRRSVVLNLTEGCAVSQPQYNDGRDEPLETGVSSDITYLGHTGISGQGHNATSSRNPLSTGRTGAPTKAPGSSRPQIPPPAEPGALEAAIAEDNLKLIKKLVMLTRIKLGLAGRSNTSITRLTLPAAGEGGRMGQWTCIHPLDVRFRVVRLLDSWIATAAARATTEDSDPKMTKPNIKVNQGVDGASPDELFKDVHFRNWALRQIHVIHVSISFKLWRLVRFLPQKGAAFEKLNGWGDGGTWRRRIRLPRFPPEADDFFFGRLNTLIRLFELALEILSSLVDAVEGKTWGEEVEVPTNPSDVHRSALGLRRLLKIMSCIASLDRLIRVRISEDERGLANLAFANCKADTPRLLGRKNNRLNFESYDRAQAKKQRYQFKRRSRRNQSVRSTSSDGDVAHSSDGDVAHSSDGDGSKSVYDSEDEYYDTHRGASNESYKHGEEKHGSKGSARWKRFAVQSSTEFAQLMQQCPQADILDLYWAYEIPLLQLVLTYLWKSIADTQTADDFDVDGPSLATGVVVASYTVQLGLDPSCCRDEQPLPFILATLSMQTHCLLLVEALWRDAAARSLYGTKSLASDLDWELEGESSGSISPRRVAGVIPTSALRLILRLLDVDDFSDWLLVLPPQSATVGRRRGSVAAGPMALQLAQAKRSQEVKSKRADRLIGYSSPDPWDTLCRHRGQNRSLQSASSIASEPPSREVALNRVPHPGGRDLSDYGDPDFFVVEVSDLQETTEDLPELFQALENIREEPEGVSLIAPSRVERVMMEVLCCRLITARFRREIANVLSDYRYQLEPEALPLVVRIWDRLHRMMYSSVPSVPPVMPELNQFNINLPLTTLLNGPAASYNLYRHFIFQTIVSLSNRLFTVAKIALNREPDISLRDVVDLADDSPDRMRAQEEAAAVVGVFSTALKSFVAEVRGELEFYPPLWRQLLPTNQHPLIVVFASRCALSKVLSDLLSSPFWSCDDVPPGGTGVLEGIAAFERLVREVRFATQLDLPAEPDLLQGFSSSLTGALNKRFRAVGETLRRCMGAEQFEPAAGQRYSVNLVDLFSLVHHLFQALEDLHVSMQRTLPGFLQFLGQISQDYGNFILAGCRDENLFALKDSADGAFGSLCQPAARVEGLGGLIDISALGDLHGKKRGGKTGGANHGGTNLLKGLGKIAGGWGLAGGRKKKSPQLLDGFGGPGTTESASGYDIPPNHQLSAVPSSGPDSPRGSHRSFGCPGGSSELQAASGEIVAPGPGELSDSDRSERSASITKPTAKQKRKKKKKKATNVAAMPQIPLPENFSELTARLGTQLPLRHVMLRKSFAKSPLRSWAMRLHNLQHFSDQLPGIAHQFQENCAKAIRTRDPRAAEVIAVLQTGENRPLEKYSSRVGTDEVPTADFLSYEDVAMIEKLQSILVGAVSSCQSAVRERARHVCRYASLRVIYYDFGPDLFEELYNPDFSRYTLASIVGAFGDTVERFVSSCPAAFQKWLYEYILEDLVKAWMLIVTELGYQGTVFTPADLSVLDEDLEAVKEFCNRHSLPGKVEIQAGSKAAKEVNIFSHIRDFFGLLASKPEIMAQLGGTYDPDEPVRRKALAAEMTAEAADNKPGGPGDADAGDDPVPVPLDALFGGDPLDFIAREGAFPGTKKKKKGWAKMLGL